MSKDSGVNLMRITLNKDESAYITIRILTAKTLNI